MRRFLANSGWMVVAVLPLALALGCTNSDPLAGSVNALTLEFEITNPQTRFDDAFLSIRDLLVEPVDPQSQSVLGNRITLIQSSAPSGTYEFDFNGRTSATFLPPLPNGRYRVVGLAIAGLFFIDSDPPTSNATCADGVPSYPTDQFSSPVQFNDLGSEVTFDVENGLATGLALHIDGQAFVQSLGESFEFYCVFDGTSWSIPFFDETAVIFDLGARASEFLTFE